MTPTITLYGIPNCETVKKSRQWFDDHGLAADFHDFKKQGVPEAQLQQWVAQLGWEPLLNRKGTTWRKLPPDVQASVTDATSAMALMCQQPSVIKRPVMTRGPLTTVGFAPDQWEALR